MKKYTVTLMIDRKVTCDVLASSPEDAKMKVQKRFASILKGVVEDSNLNIKIDVKEVK